MKWLTQKEVKSRSNTEKRAIKCCFDHWAQLYEATPAQLRKAPKYFITTDYCALCKRYYGQRDRCKGCPLDCISFWGDASDALDIWRLKSNQSNYKKWREAAKALLNRIEKLL